MTTLTYDGKTLASDSQTTILGSDDNHIIIQTQTRKLYQHGNLCWGFRGDVDFEPIFQRWVIGGMDLNNKPDIPHDADFSVLMIDGGKAYLYGAMLERFEAGCPASVGSGSPFALGAMANGADAATAVKIASCYDPFTGGPVQTVTP